jgi:cobalamin biosynthesis Mg chelatase CobN
MDGIVCGYREDIANCDTWRVKAAVETHVGNICNERPAAGAQMFCPCQNSTGATVVSIALTGVYNLSTSQLDTIITAISADSGVARGSFEVVVTPGNNRTTVRVTIPSSSNSASAGTSLVSAASRPSTMTPSNIQTAAAGVGATTSVVSSSGTGKSSSTVAIVVAIVVTLFVLAGIAGVSFYAMQKKKAGAKKTGATVDM